MWRALPQTLRRSWHVITDLGTTQAALSTSQQWVPALCAAGADGRWSTCTRPFHQSTPSPHAEQLTSSKKQSSGRPGEWAEADVAADPLNSAIYDLIHRPPYQKFTRPRQWREMLDYFRKRKPELRPKNKRRKEWDRNWHWQMAVERQKNKERLLRFEAECRKREKAQERWAMRERLGIVPGVGIGKPQE